MNILVIGAGSYMGGYLIPELLKRGHSVTAAFHNTTNKIAGVKSVSLDITNSEKFTSLPANVDAVINFSAYIGEDWEHCRRVNIEGVKNILEYCVRSGVRTFIHSSSTAVYGTPQFLPLTERHPLQANTNYGKSKLAAESLILQSAAKHGFRAVLFRYASPFGFGQKAVSVLPLFIQKAREGGTLEYYGDGSRTQEFVYVKDIVAAHIAALESSAQGAFNIGSGNVVSMKFLAELIAQIFGKGRAKVAAKNVPDAGVNMAVDSSKAARELGYRASWPIEEALYDYRRLMDAHL